MNHNGGFPPIYEGGKKEVVQREFSAENILSISQIFNNQLSSNSPKIIMKRSQPIVYNIVDTEPKLRRNSKKNSRKNSRKNSKK
jgi:hypothetical protein